MDILLALLTTTCFLALPLGLAAPSVRRAAIALALVTAVGCLLHGVLGPAQRELVVTHLFAAYQDHEVVGHDFPVDDRSAPGWQWPLPFAAYALLWSLLLWLHRRNEPRSAVLLPLLCCWTGVAALLAMQVLAAPADVVQPFGLERVLYPGCLAMAILLARSGRGFGALLLMLCLCVFVVRVPVAAFSKFASDRELGTGLDIHRITVFAHPLARTEIEAAPGSWEQQEWLIWRQHLMFLPAFYFMSLSGVAIAVLLFRRHQAQAG